MEFDYFNYSPEPLVIIDDKKLIFKSNEKFKMFFNFEIKEGMSIELFNFKNNNNQLIFISPFFESYFEFEFENREVYLEKGKDIILNFLCSNKRIKIENRDYYYLSFKNITDLVSFKKIFEELYDSLSAKTIELDKVITEKENAYKLLKEKDDEMLRQLYLAHEMQENIFPNVAKNIKGYSINSMAKAASIVSGDVIFVWDNEEEYLDLVIADVTGHGVPSAFITMMLKMSLQTRRDEIKDAYDIVEAVKNDMYPILSKATIFITLLFARLYYNTGKIDIIDCGHIPPIIKKNDNNIFPIDINGLMLGVTDQLDVGKISLTLDKDDIIFFITDGIIEAQNSKGEFFEDKFFTILKNIKNRDLKEIIDILLKKIYQFTGSEELKDDATILCIKRD